MEALAGVNDFKLTNNLKPKQNYGKKTENQSALFDDNKHASDCEIR